MQDMHYVDAPSLGKTKLSDWMEQYADILGKNYFSELAQRRDRASCVWNLEEKK